MASKKKPFDTGKIVGLMVALAIFLGAQLWMKSREHGRQEARKEWQLKDPENAKNYYAEQRAKNKSSEKGDTTTKDSKPQNTSPDKEPEINPTPDTDGQSEKDPADPKDPDKDPTSKPDTPKTTAKVKAKAIKAAPPVKIPGLHLDLQFISKGASLKTAVLADVKPKAASKTLGVEFLDEIERDKLSLVLTSFTFNDKEYTDLDSRIWKLESDSKAFKGKNQTWKAIYSTQLLESKDGKTVPVCKVTKTFRLVRDSRHLSVAIGIENLSKKSASYSYALRGPAGILLDGPPEDPKQGAYVELKCMLASRSEKDEEPDLKPLYHNDAVKEELERRISAPQNLWSSHHNRFFMATIIPIKPDQIIKIVVEPINIGDGRTDLDTDLRYYKQPNLTSVLHRKIRMDSFKLAAGTKSEPEEYLLYMGPSKNSLLHEYEKTMNLPSPIFLNHAVQYCDIGSDTWGWRWPRIDWLAGILLSIFSFIHRVTGSFGLAVILLTLTVKLCLHPLQRKMTVSMHKMQLLQPKLKAIDEKYKGTTKPEIRQKREMEKFALMRKEGANPMGCLPMFVQMPIFFALYGTFRFAFEIRQAEFLWIVDLSLPDRMAQLPFWPHEFNLLPLIYMAMTWFQMKMQPRPVSSDPQQEMNRKMMTYMPVLFGILFYKMPAGLVLYFAASACFGFLESTYVKRFVLKVDADGKPLGGSKSSDEPPNLLPMTSGAKS